MEPERRRREEKSDPQDSYTPKFKLDFDSPDDTTNIVIVFGVMKAASFSNIIEKLTSPTPEIGTTICIPAPKLKPSFSLQPLIKTEIEEFILTYHNYAKPAEV